MKRFSIALIARYSNFISTDKRFSRDKTTSSDTTRICNFASGSN